MVWELSARTRFVFTQAPESMELSQAEHRAMIEALRARDGEELERLARAQKERAFALVSPPPAGTAGGPQSPIRRPHGLKAAGGRANGVPFIEIMVYGRSVTLEEKEKLFEGCREVAANVLGSAPTQVRIAVHEWDEQKLF